MRARGPIRREDLKGSGASVFVMRPSWDGHQHRTPATHPFAAVLYCTGGNLKVEQSGTWALAAGDLLLVPAGQPHRMLERKQPQAWGLGFCVACFAAGEGAAVLLEPFERVRDGGSAVVHVSAGRRPFLESLFRELEGASVEAVRRSLLTLVLAEVDRARQVSQADSTASSVVADSLRFIERNCLRRLTLREVANAVHRSPAYVTTALTRATGRSAVEWMTAGRMAEARRRLLHSDERVDIIAERVGYADPSHFIRMFRREHAATPAAWRLTRRESGARTEQLVQRAPSPAEKVEHPRRDKTSASPPRARKPRVRG